MSDDELNLSKIYNTAYELQSEALEPVIEDLKKKYARSLETFDDDSLSAEEKKRMQMFSFIVELSYDVYVKKLLIEKILDNAVTEKESKKAKEKAKDKSKDKGKDKK